MKSLLKVEPQPSVCPRTAIIIAKQQTFLPFSFQLLQSSRVTFGATRRPAIIPTMLRNQKVYRPVNKRQKTLNVSSVFGEYQLDWGFEDHLQNNCTSIHIIPQVRRGSNTPIRFSRGVHPRTSFSITSIVLASLSLLLYKPMFLGELCSTTGVVHSRKKFLFLMILIEYNQVLG